MGKRYQVFVSSTYEDLRNEREHVISELNRFGHIAVAMEQFPSTAETQMDHIKRIIDDSDYYIVIIKGRYGSLAENGLSYTEMEYNYAKEKGKPALCFLYKNMTELPVKDTDNDPDKMKKLRVFVERFKSDRIVSHWNDEQDLATSISHSLYNIIRLRPGIGWVRGDQVMDPKTLTKLEELRTENEELKRALGSLRESDDIESMLEKLREEKIKISCGVMVKILPHDSKFIRKDVVEVSLVTILLAIDDSLYKEHDDSIFYREINTQCVKKIKLEENQFLTFSDRDKQKIRAKLEHLELVDVVPWGRGLSWKATPKGRKLINALRLSEPDI